MSLLPKQILPETEPLGTVSPGGEVRISHNWYLLLYNLTAQVLGGAAAPPTPAPIAIVVGPSPFTYTATNPGLLAITGGLLSKIKLLRGSVTVNLGISVETIPVVMDDEVTITYNELPLMTLLPFTAT